MTSTFFLLLPHNVVRNKRTCPFENKHQEKIKRDFRFLLMLGFFNRLALWTICFTDLSGLDLINLNLTVMYISYVNLQTNNRHHYGYFCSHIVDCYVLFCSEMWYIFHSNEFQYDIITSFNNNFRYRNDLLNADEDHFFNSRL